MVIANGNKIFSKNNKREFSYYIEAVNTDLNLISFSISVEIKEQL